MEAVADLVHSILGRWGVVSAGRMGLASFPRVEAWDPASSSRSTCDIDSPLSALRLPYRLLALDQPLQPNNGMAADCDNHRPDVLHSVAHRDHRDLEVESVHVLH